MTSLAIVRPSYDYILDLRDADLLADYTLVKTVRFEPKATGKTVQDWSGITYRPAMQRLYMISNGTDKIRVLDQSGKMLRGQDIQVHGAEDSEDIVYVEEAAGGKGVFYIVQEKRWWISRIELSDEVSSVAKADVVSFSLAGVAGGPGIGKKTGNDGLEGLAYDPDQKRLLVCREKDEMRVLAVSLADLKAPEAFSLEERVGPGKANREADVRAVQAALQLHGHFGAPTGSFDGATEEAVKAFQQAAGLKVDGKIKPKGATHSALMGRNEYAIPVPADKIEDLSEALLNGDNPTDLAGLFYRDGSLLLLSDESKVVIDAPFDGGIAKEHSRLKLEQGVANLPESVPQAEGICMDDRGTLYIVTEDQDGPDRMYIFKPRSKADEALKTEDPIKTEVAGEQGAMTAALDDPKEEKKEQVASAIVEKDPDEQDYGPANKDFRLSGPTDGTSGDAKDAAKVAQRLADLGYSGQTIDPTAPNLHKHVRDRLDDGDDKDFLKSLDKALRKMPRRALSPVEKVQNESFHTWEDGFCHSWNGSKDKWKGDEPGQVLPGSMTHRALMRPIVIYDTVGEGKANNASDVQMIKERLWALGLLDWDEINGDADANLFAKIEEFQAWEPKGDVDGVIGPTGKTLKKLNGFRREHHRNNPTLKGAATQHARRLEHHLQAFPNGCHDMGYWSCGPSSVTIALRYLKPKFARGLNEFETIAVLCDEVGTTCKSNDFERVENMVKFSGVAYERCSGNDSIAWLTNQLKAGRVVLSGGNIYRRPFCDHKDETSGHYLLITGMDTAGNFFFCDPGRNGTADINKKAATAAQVVAWWKGEKDYDKLLALSPDDSDGRPWGQGLAA